MTARTSDLVQTIENVGTAFDTFKKTQEVAQAELQTRQLELLDRIEELESRASTPGKTAQIKRNDEHMRLFTAWLRKPHDEKARTELGNFQSDLERKDVSIGSLPGGGYSVPEEIVREIERIEMKYSPVRGLVKVIRISTGDAKQLVNVRGTDVRLGW
jgi:HK97 family phage major capsid protein